MSVAAYFVYLDIRLKDYLGARYHLGAAYIRAFLAQHGIRSEQYLAPSTRHLDDIADELAGKSPAFVGFTVFDRNFHLVRLLAQKVRERLPDALIVAGGPTATFSYELLLQRCPAFDLCVLHHGEQPCLALLQPLLSGRAPVFAEIPQLAIRSASGVALTGPGRVEHGRNRDGALDRFPSPYLSGSIPFEFGCHVGVVTSRGCPFHCSFCNFSAMSTRVVEYHSIERTVEELKALDQSLAHHGVVTRLEILDDLFTVNRKRTLTLCAAIEAARLQHLALWCETRADLVDEEVLEHLARAGVREMNFGLESIDPQVLSAIHKVRGGTARHADFLQYVRRAVLAARAVGVAPFVSLIFGLPMETPAVARRTLDFIESLPLEGYSHNFLHVEPGTELWHTHSHYGISVSEGPQILPYRTTHAYDVYREVPVRPHRMSLERMTRSAHALRFAERLSGDIQQRSDGEPLSFACLSGAVEPRNLEARWWSSAVGPATAIALLTGLLRPGEYDDWLSAAARFGLPLFRIDVAQQDEAGWVLADDGPALQAAAEYRLRRITSGNQGDLNPEEEDSVLVFRELSTDATPERAADWVRSRAEQDAHSLSEVTLELSCRWTCRACPAATYSAAWIDERGVRPCPPAPPQQPRQLKDLAAHEATAYAEEMRRRGCATCEVRQTCPKCLHTAPLEPAEYCLIQRRGRMLESALLLEIARLLDRSTRNQDSLPGGGLRIERVLARDIGLAGAWQTTTTLVMARRDTTWILYDAESARLWQIPEALSLLLEVAGRGELHDVPHVDALCRSLERLGLVRSASGRANGCKEDGGQPIAEHGAMEMPGPSCA